MGSIMDHTRIRNQLEALAELRQELKTGEHVGAGLTVSITIGAVHDRSKSIDFGIGDGSQDVLEAMEDGLIKTLKISKSLTKSQILDLEAAFEAMDTTPGLF